MVREISRESWELCSRHGCARPGRYVRIRNRGSWLIFGGYYFCFGGQVNVNRLIDLWPDALLTCVVELIALVVMK